MSFIEKDSIINLNSLYKNIINLRQEILHCYSLIQKNYHEKIDHKIEIRKEEIEETKTKIEFLNQYIKENIDKYIKLRREIEKEKEIKNKLEKKSKKIDDFINKGKKILINDLPYFDKLPEYANKKLKIATLSPLDLINLTLRLSQQNKAPPGGAQYLNEIVNLGLNNERQNDFNLFYYYINNKNRYLYPFPGPLELKNSVLRYDYSEENRLKPPILIEPNPDIVDVEGNIIANKGSLIKLKYPSEKPIMGLFFKYSKDINIAPSFYSGEEYKEFALPDLDKDCIFKVCSCKKGLKDSKIITFKFIINHDIEEKLIQKEALAKARIDQIGRERNKIENVGLAFSSQPSFNSGDSPHDSNSNPGTSNYVPRYYSPNDIDEENDEDDDI